MPPTGSIPRLSRILAVVPWVINHPEQATVEEVCRRFGLSRDQLIDDMALLTMCGLPPFTPGDLIEAWVEDERVVISMADYLDKPLRMSRWEALGLLAAGRALAALPALTEAQALERALAKLAEAIAPDEADAAATLAERVAIELQPASPEILAALRDAIEERRRLRIEYYSFGRDELTERTVSPLLVFGTGPWYLIADDDRSGERRTFRVDRIRHAQPTGDTFERPLGFDPTREADQPLYRPSPGDVKVVLELSPAASWVAELTPHEEAKPVKGGWTRMTLRASHTAWLARLVLQLGGDVRVIEPDTLAAEAGDLATAALVRYGV
ncbi:MAG TPA: WYL domain-containing protein [Actinomycetota bacterium]|nr:WYL domain-containing protein [Actinomycetota bacterium]